MDVSNQIKMQYKGQEAVFEVGGAYVIDEDIYLALFDSGGELYSYKVLAKGIERTDKMDSHVYAIFKAEALGKAAQNRAMPINLHLHVDELPEKMKNSLPPEIIEMMGGANGTD